MSKLIFCDWGENGLLNFINLVDVVVIIDVLSFSTCVDIAIANDAFVYPYLYKDHSAITFAKNKNAEIANKRGLPGFTLSPFSLTSISAGTKLVLPSPNGSALSTKCKGKHLFTACLRNATAVAEAINQMNNVDNIAVIAAGERWPNETLRVSYEDLIGAGALICKLKGTLSPEAQIAVEVFRNSQSNYFNVLKEVRSGIELINYNYESDVILASEYDVSASVPYFLEDEYYCNYLKI